MSPEWFFVWHQNVPGGTWHFAGHFYGARHQAVMLVDAMAGRPWRLTDSLNYDVQPSQAPSFMQPPAPGILQPPLAKGEEFWWTK